MRIDRRAYLSLSLHLLPVIVVTSSALHRADDASGVVNIFITIYRNCAHRYAAAIRRLAWLRQSDALEGVRAVPAWLCRLYLQHAAAGNLCGDTGRKAGVACGADAAAWRANAPSRCRAYRANNAWRAWRIGRRCFCRRRDACRLPLSGDGVGCPDASRRDVALRGAATPAYRGKGQW